MSNILLVGLLNDELKEIGLALAERLKFFYLNCEELISYSLIDIVEMEKVCGIEYLRNQEKKVVYSLNSYERTIISMTYETFSNNFEVISNANKIIYVRISAKEFSKKLKFIKKDDIDYKNKHNYEISELVFFERDKFIKNHCDLIVKYNSNNKNNLINIIEKQIWSKNEN